MLVCSPLISLFTVLYIHIVLFPLHFPFALCVRNNFVCLSAGWPLFDLAVSDRQELVGAVLNGAI